MKAARNSWASEWFRTGSIFWTQSRVRVTAWSRQIDRHRWEAGTGEIVSEIAAPTSIIEHHPATLSIRDLRNAHGSQARGPQNRIRRWNWTRGPNCFPASQSAVDQSFPSLSRPILGEGESMSRVRFAAHKPRALDIDSPSPGKKLSNKKAKESYATGTGCRRAGPTRPTLPALRGTSSLRRHRSAPRPKTNISP
jgi:hypothetical protein